MKKMFCVFLVIIMMTGLTLPGFAQDGDAIRISMRAEHAEGTTAYFDLPSSGSNLAVSVSFDKIAEYEEIEVQIRSNNVLAFNGGYVTDDGVTFKSVSGSGNTGYFTARFNKEYLGTEYEGEYCNGVLLFRPVRAGTIDFTVIAYGTDLNGNKIRLDVEYENALTEIKEYYDIKIDAHQIFTYDETQEGGGSVHVSIPELEKFGYVKIFVDFNTEILQYNTGYYQPVAVYSESQRATDTGMCFTVSWNDKYADRNDGWGYSTSGFIKSLGEGDVNFSVRVEATDPEGNIIEPKVKISEPYRVVKNKADLDYVEPNESADIRHGGYICFNGEITNGEALKCVDGNNILIAEHSGITTLYDEALVTNGGKFYTIFNGYIVDSVPICVMGDATCDGRITAADARLALRIAAKLETAEWIVNMAADVDGNGKVTAADARRLLRIPAGLA